MPNSMYEDDDCYDPDSSIVHYMGISLVLKAFYHAEKYIIPDSFNLISSYCY